MLVQSSKFHCQNLPNFKIEATLSVPTDGTFWVVTDTSSICISSTVLKINFWNCNSVNTVRGAVDITSIFSFDNSFLLRSLAKATPFQQHYVDQCLFTRKKDCSSCKTWWIFTSYWFLLSINHFMATKKMHYSCFFSGTPSHARISELLQSKNSSRPPVNIIHTKPSTRTQQKVAHA